MELAQNGKSTVSKVKQVLGKELFLSGKYIEIKYEKSVPFLTFLDQRL